MGQAYLPAGTILTVNTDPIDSREFLLQMGANRVNHTVFDKVVA